MATKKVRQQKFPLLLFIIVVGSGIQDPVCDAKKSGCGIIITVQTLLDLPTLPGPRSPAARPRGRKNPPSSSLRSSHYSI
jgi:hypothetical protein